MPPTIVLVPGMWHTAGCFSALRSELSPEYDTIARTLPCVGPPDPAKVGLIDDIEFIRGELLKPCLEEEKDVVLVMHSYGGIPGSVAVEGLGRADVESQGKRGGIVGLVYLSVIVIPVGESQADASRRAGLDFSRWYTFADDMSVTRLNPESALEQFYDDLPREEAEKWISQLQPFAAGASTVKTPYSAPHHSEWTSKYRYVEMTKDNAISLSLQRAAAGDMRREPALDRGHSAFLSKPRETAESIRWCIEDIRGNS